MAVTDTTPRTLDCGKTIEELSDYLSADRIPYDPSIETCPECLNALQALTGVSQLSRDLLAHDAANLPAPPANWMEQIMSTIHDEVRAGRSVPLHHPDPRVILTVTEGALRALIRSVGDTVPGIIIGTCQFDGDVETPGAPIDVTVTASIAWKYPIPEAARELRDAVRDALSTHSHLNIMLINVTVEDLHGHNTAEEMP
ncbi:Asp23/Gls24 family envelope stress response protein [Microbacterium oxydans]|uniref:Asp23/Gls24 family envelope stress response protein n=1 Tax=Microbacterium algeriense TaxID=2615184 RepID=UPI002597D9D8|nr:Asp23/Gls24 family envelope stress response protein [uncultured Microbacterium sp.]